MPSRSAGFTLIETVVVISILGILATFALPKLSDNLNSYHLDAAARTLVSDIRIVQQLAVNTGNNVIYTLRFHGDGYYWILEDDTRLKTVYLPKTIKWATTPTSIRFNENGVPETNSSQTIRLVSTANSEFLNVIIAPVTGRVRYTNLSSSGNQ